MEQPNTLPKIFCIGASGLVGSRVVELLSNTFQFTRLGRVEGVDITDPTTLKLIQEDHEHSIIVHFAAKTDVDACEKDKEFGMEGEAWKINVGGVQNIIDVALFSRKKIIYISTDFIFDGVRGNYTESDLPNPLNWYGITKYRAEQLVKASKLPYLILRFAYPYRANFSKKKDFMRNILDRLSNGQEVNAITDHIFAPTFIDDIAYALKKLLETNSEGIFHVGGGDNITPYNAACKIADTFNLSKTLIKQTTREQFFKGRAPRPYNLGMKHDKIAQLGVEMSTFEEGLREIKNQNALQS